MITPSQVRSGRVIRAHHVTRPQKCLNSCQVDSYLNLLPITKANEHTTLQSTRSECCVIRHRYLSSYKFEKKLLKMSHFFLSTGTQDS